MTCRTAAVALLAWLTLLVSAPAAMAAPSVSVQGVGGGAQASLDGPTTLRLSGTGFQSIPGGFGGIYVVFGWVDDAAGGSWRPSQGGHTGSDYDYVPDTESAQNQGYIRFVSFPGSDTEASANGGTVSADGSWSTELTVPGPTFTAQGRDGATTQIDCTQVQCGVLTFGAHGVVNPSNESFTPVTFVSGSTGSAAGTGGTGESADPDAETERVAPTLGVDQATAVVGRALTFAGQGFDPGEQLTVTLDDGLVSLGPLTAGAQGEIAGALQLPGDLRVGTHLLRVAAAGSGLTTELEFTVTADPAAVSAAELIAAETEDAGHQWTAAEVALAVAGGLLLITVLVSLVTAQRRRRAAARVASTPDGPRVSDPTGTPGPTRTPGPGTTGESGPTGTPDATSTPDPTVPQGPTVPRVSSTVAPSSPPDLSGDVTPTEVLR
ncbi:hypothetical protein [Cellulomonas sp. NPDC089187]|uniref:hypothetical protein n=1 Tax=Cellulomonas sp. NPDC089187 TaxID=3154970 RepID=UPI00343A2D57